MLELNDADVILTIREWAALVGIGYSSARKMLREGNGPKKDGLIDAQNRHRNKQPQGMDPRAHWLTARNDTGRVSDLGILPVLYRAVLFHAEI
jgi:hypothetical protein